MFTLKCVSDKYRAHVFTLKCVSDKWLANIFFCPAQPQDHAYPLSPLWPRSLAVLRQFRGERGSIAR